MTRLRPAAVWSQWSGAGLCRRQQSSLPGMHPVELVALAAFTAIGIAAAIGVPPPWGLL